MDRSIQSTLLICAYLFSSSALSGPTAPDTELYVGYYLESPINNPEDPVPGSLFLNLPTSDGPFAGDMLFTYEGCQSQSIGSVAGDKQVDALSGMWAGMVDNTAQSGDFMGSRDDTGAYVGTYTVDGGKQSIVVQDCIEYFIAAFGTWVLFPNAQTSPDDDLIQFAEDAIELTPVVGVLFAHCQLIDIDLATGNQTNATRWQQIVPGNTLSIDVPTTVLVDGTDYTAACGQFDDQLLPLAFSKTAFTYSGATSADAIFSDSFEQP